jgi:hypothetical protein
LQLLKLSFEELFILLVTVFFFVLNQTTSSLRVTLLNGAVMFKKHFEAGRGKNSTTISIKM